MNNKEAIKTIKSNYPTENYTVLRNALDMAIKALEKQIPLPFSFDNEDYNICPICRKHVNSEDKYCKRCGQAIYL